MIGKTVYKSNLFNSSIDVSSFSDGSYLVEILLNNNTKMTQKLLINKGGSN